MYQGTYKAATKTTVAESMSKKCTKKRDHLHCSRMSQDVFTCHEKTGEAMDSPCLRFPTRQEPGNVTQTPPSPSQIAEASIASHQPVRK